MLWKDWLIMPKMPQFAPIFQSSLTLLAGNAKKYVICRIYISDSVKLPCQDNHTVDSKLV